MPTWLFEAWAIGSGVTGGVGLLSMSWGLLDYNSRYANRKENARSILAGMCLIITSWAWPVILAVLVTVGGPKLVNSLMKDAEIPTLAERREAKRISRERVLKEELAKRKQIINDLEREAGLPKELA